MIILNSVKVDSRSVNFYDVLYEKEFYKIYHDGGHYVGTKLFFNKTKFKKASKRKIPTEVDKVFDTYYQTAKITGLKEYKNYNPFEDFILSGMCNAFPDHKNMQEYVEKNIKRKKHNMYVRKKRLRRKAYLNNWNYWVTLTYDNTKHNAEDFRKKLRKCLSNLKCRKHWRYIGVFERSPEENRVHFHAIMYIPNGEMPGKLKEIKSYSTKTQRIETRNENSFFAKRFGINDFTPINTAALKNGNMIEYMLKYMEKQSERLVYSRGVPSEVCKLLPITDVITQFTDYVDKYVFFDDVLDWESDIYRPVFVQTSFVT